MRSIMGAVGMLMLAISAWLCPPDHDPSFVAAPANIKALAAVGIVALIAGGISMIVGGILLGGKDEKSSKQQH